MGTGENGSQDGDKGGGAALLDSCLEEIGGLEKNSTGETGCQASEEMKGGMGFLGALAAIGHDLEGSGAVVDMVLVIRVGVTEMACVERTALMARAWFLQLVREVLGL
jgi:hypothetical protein